MAVSSLEGAASETDESRTALGNSGKQSLCEDEPPPSNLLSSPEARCDQAAEVTVEEDDRVIKPPDGGWGWVIVLASALSHIIIGGVERSGGVLFLFLIEKFNSSASYTSWAMSLSGGFRLLTGPLASGLSHRFGFRPVVFVGGIAATVGCILAAFAPELIYVHLAFGFVGGLGRGLSYTPSVVIVGTYFDKRRGLAIGLATAGVGVGSFVLPPLLNYIFEQFGYSGCFLLLGGYTFHICICAMLFRPLQSKRPKKTVVKAEEEIRPAAVASGGEEDSSVQFVNRRADKDTKTLLQSDSENSKDSQTKEYSASSSRRKSFVKTTKKFLELGLLKDPFFLSFCITIGLFTMAIQIIFAFLPALGESKNLTATESALLVSIMGVIDVLARIFSGVMFDIKTVRPYRRYIYNACLLLISLTAWLTPLAANFGSFVAVSLIYGILSGLYIAQKSVIIVDIVGKDKLIASFGIVVWFQGIGTFIGPPIAGKLRDSFDNYDLAFQFGGAVTALAGAVLLVSNVCFFYRSKTVANAEEKS